MYEGKKEEEIEAASKKQSYLTSDKEAYLTFTGTMDVTKPFHGYYQKNSKVMVQNIIEKFELEDKVYRFGSFATASKEYSGQEYLVSVNTKTMEYVYECRNVVFSKKIHFVQGKNILRIDYCIANNSNQDIVFKVAPFLTYRDLLLMKKSTVLKFNKRSLPKGILVNLSVTDSENISLTSDKAIFHEIDSYLNNVVHELINANLVKETFIEDLYIPGEFELPLACSQKEKFSLYLSDKEIVESDCIEQLKQEQQDSIKQEYVELKKLASAISAFDREVLCSSLPCKVDFSKLLFTTNENYIDTCIQELTLCIQAIEGQYLSLHQVEKAEKRLKQMIRYIQIIEKKTGYNKEKYLILKLWSIEQVYKLLSVSENSDSCLKEYLLHEITQLPQQIQEQSYLCSLEITCLLYNAFKIYETIASDISYYELASSLKNKIMTKFWNERSKCLKQNLQEQEVYSSAMMIYALSLSFPILEGEYQIKLLDTIFKELYTPYGLRRYAKSSPKYDGNIYPLYMAHFVKANLRQNGVTFASQKLSYNLVKELLLEIDHTVLNSVKKIYHEKNINIQMESIDLLTTAEMIRLYDMLI